MTEKNEKEDLLNQLRLVKEEVAQIKKRLSVIGKEKEKLFSEKRSVSDQIKDKISGVMGQKGSRNSFTHEARKAKQERDKLNKQIADKIAEIKKMKSAYKDVAGKLGIKGNPSGLKTQIDKLEMRLETEPMSFDKEQKLMKHIKDIKKQYLQFKGVHKEWELVTKMSKDIDVLKKKANEFHRKVQESAKSSQSEHESILEDSKGIDDLKKKEDDLYKLFLEKKSAFKDVNTELKTKLTELQEIKKKLETHNVVLAEAAKEKEQKSLKEKAAEVEEKISKKKKLTTEDLLIMQRTGK